MKRDVVFPDDKKLSFRSGFFCNDNFFFPAWNCNGLFSYNFISKKVTFHMLLPTIYSKFDYGFVYRTDANVYLSPCQGPSIIELSMKELLNYDEYELDEKQIGEVGVRYGCIFRKFDYLFFRPYGSHSIARLNLLNKEMNYYSDFYEELTNEIDGRMYFAGSAYIDNKLIFVCQNTNKIIAFDTVKEKSELFEVEGQEVCLVNVCSDEDKLWILSSSGELIKRDLNTGKSSVYILSSKGFQTDATMCIYDSKLWISGSENSMITVNTKNGSIEKIDVGGEEIIKCSLSVIDGVLFAFSKEDGYFYIYEENKSSFIKHDLIMSDEVYSEYLNMLFHEQKLKGEIVYERNTNALKNYIDAINISSL